MELAVVMCLDARKETETEAECVTDGRTLALILSMTYNDTWTYENAVVATVSGTVSGRGAGDMEIEGDEKECDFRNNCRNWSV